VVGDYDTRNRSFQAAGVKDGDRLVAAAVCREGDHVVLAHSGGYVARFAAEEVRPMGRSAAGVIGMDIPAGEEIVALSVVAGGAVDAEVLTVATDGTGKRAPLDDYPVKGRGVKGLQTGANRLAWCGVATDLHLGGDAAEVVRPVDLPEKRRGHKNEPLGLGQVGHVVAEQIQR
jgi:DNA gyrase subunit A